MSASDRETRLQDYLDGRLDDEAKTRFEAELRDDTDLAARLAAALEVRETLRGEEPEALPEAFYTRARARFEAETRVPRRVPWGWVGLAGATLLAAALFIPLLQHGELAPTARDLATPPPDGKSDGDARPSEAEEKASDDEALAQYAPAPVEPEEEVQPAPAPKRQVLRENVAIPQPEMRPAAPPPPVEVAEAAEPEAPAAVFEDADEGARALSRGDVEALQSVGYVADSPFPAVRAHAVGAALKKKAELRDEEDGRRESGAVKVSAATMPTRTVTLGTVGGVERCEWVVARRLADRWELVREAEVEDASAERCAIDLPVDGLPVWLDGRRVDEP